MVASPDRTQARLPGVWLGPSRQARLLGPLMSQRAGQKSRGRLFPGCVGKSHRWVSAAEGGWWTPRLGPGRDLGALT